MPGIVTIALISILIGLNPAPIRGLPDTDSPLVLGMSTALSGPAAELGNEVRSGVLAAFNEVNRAGGVHGRRVELIALDDGYEPARTGPNIHALVDEYNVIAVIGDVGTPTAVAALPVINDRRVAFFGAFTGAGLLRRSPPDRYVINFRASYAQETEAMVQALVAYAGIRPEEVAFFTQRDAYGDSGYRGGIAALKKHGLARETDVAHGRYERNTLVIENALADILSAPTRPRAVIMVGAYAPCARFIQVARQSGLDALFLNVSFVGAPALAQAAGDAGDGVIVTQVVPPPNSDVPIAAEFRAALRNRAPEALPDHVSFEGYIAARVMIEALRNAGPLATRESVVDALLSLGKFDLGLGEPLHLAPDNPQACDHVWATIIRHGRVEPFEWTELKARSRESKDHLERTAQR